MKRGGGHLNRLGCVLSWFVTGAAGVERRSGRARSLDPALQHPGVVVSGDDSLCTKWGEAIPYRSEMVLFPPGQDKCRDMRGRKLSSLRGCFF